jgi:hypothetical protein
MHYNMPDTSRFLLVQYEAIILFVRSLSGAKDVAEWVEGLLVHFVLHNAILVF